MTDTNRFGLPQWKCVLLLTVAIQVAATDFSYALQAPKTEVYEIISPDPIFDWILDKESGRVFASVQNGNEIVEFSATMKAEIRRFQVGRNPERMLIKNKRLIVACQEPTQLTVIDLAKNKVETNIALDCKYVSGLTATKLDDSILYAITGHSNKYSDPIIYKIDLDSKKVVSSIKEQQGHREYIVNGVISNLGSGFVFDRRGYVSPSGADFATIDSSDNSFARTTQSRESYAVINAGPADRYWTLGPTLVSFNKLKPVRKYGGDVVQIHPSLDLAVSLDVADKEIGFWQFANAKKVKSVQLDSLDTQLKSGPRKKTWRYNRDVADPRLQFDLKNSAVFCGLRKTAFLIPHSTLESKPQVLIESIPQRRIQIGNELAATLKLTNRSLSEKATFDLVSGPKSARLDGKKLTWTPSVMDVGDHQLVISTEVNGVADSLTLNLEVLGNEIDLGFPTQTWSVSPSGKFAVAWGVKTGSGREFVRPSSTGTPMQLVVVDLEKGKIVNEGRNEKPIQAAAIDDKYIYVVTQNSNVLNRFLITDLDNKKRMFLPGTGTGLTATEDGKLLTNFRGDNRGLSSMQQAVIEPETLKLDSTDPRSGNFGSSSSYVLYTQLESGEDSDGQHVYDSKSGAVKRILHAYNTGLQLVDPESMRRFQSSFGQTPFAKRWGRTYDRSSLRDGKGNQICQVQYPFAISSEFPVGVGFQVSQSRSGRITTTTGAFKFYDLAEGAEIGTQSLFKSTSANRSLSYYSSGGMIELIHLRGKTCHTIYNGKIYSAQIPDDILAKVKSPLRIVTAGELHVDLTKPKATIAFKTPGFEKVKFSMVNSVKHVEMDEETGLLTIDTAKLWQEKVSGISSSRSPFGRTSRSRQNEQQLALQKEARRRYQIPDDRIAYLLPLSIAATGDDGQSDQIQLCLIATGDKSVIDKKAELLAEQQMELKKQQAREQAERRAAMEDARNAAAQKQENDRNSDSAKEAEISELKKKIRRLEAVIDSLIDRIEKLEDKKD